MQRYRVLAKGRKRVAQLRRLAGGGAIRCALHEGRTARRKRCPARALLPSSSSQNPVLSV
jgi:hypothetical protein